MKSAALGDADNIFTSLMARARGTPDTVLVSLGAAGSVLALGTLVFAPHFRALALPGLAVVAFGGWGLIDHFIMANVLRLSNDRRHFMRFVQRSIGAAGVVAGLASLFVLFGLALGTFVS